MAIQSTRLATNQVTGLTTTPQALAAEPQASCREVLVQSDPANMTNLNVGNSTNQFLVLTPGQSVSLPINNITSVWIKMASGTGTVNWLARD